jgi:hypothetical protein
VASEGFNPQSLTKVNTSFFILSATTVLLALQSMEHLTMQSAVDNGKLSLECILVLTLFDDFLFKLEQSKAY